MFLLRIPGFFLALIRFILLFLLVALHILPYMILSSFAFKHTPDKAFKLRKSYMNFALPILGMKIEKKGKIYDKPALYVCNHRTLSDPVALTYFLNAYVIAKAEVADIPLLNKGAKLTGVIYVKRESKGSRKATRQAMIDTVKSGLNVLVYPEGTTNGNIQTLPYRPGTFVEAAKNGIPIVPVVLEYKTKWDLWTNGGIPTQWFKQFWKLRTECKMVIGEPMLSDDFEYLREEIENWSNAEILSIHEHWKGSYFHNQLFPPNVKA